MNVVLQNLNPLSGKITTKCEWIEDHCQTFSKRKRDEDKKEMILWKNREEAKKKNLAIVSFFTQKGFNRKTILCKNESRKNGQKWIWFSFMRQKMNDEEVVNRLREVDPLNCDLRDFELVTEMNLINPFADFVSPTRAFAALMWLPPCPTISSASSIFPLFLLLSLSLTPMADERLAMMMCQSPHSSA
jgi:hypothetical protein